MEAILSIVGEIMQKRELGNDHAIAGI